MKLIFSDHEETVAARRTTVASAIVNAITKAMSAGRKPIEIAITTREASRLRKEFGMLPVKIDGVRIVVK